MEPVKFTLCPKSPECPETRITVTDWGAIFGEEANAMRLSRDAWNELVRLIKAGQLGAIKTPGSAYSP